MLDHSLRPLLDEAVNTSLKLAIVLLFADQDRLSATPKEVSKRVCRDIWSVEAALRELADDDILLSCDGRYLYAPAPQWHAGLAALLSVYDDPLLRLEIMRVVGELDRYAPYRDVLDNPGVTIFSA